MKMLALALTAALLGTVGGPAMAVPTKATTKVATDWSKTVAATPEGGIIMGNPKAKLTLVEYGSLTCSHCKHFADTGVKSLIGNYVKTGKVRYEFRSYLLNAYDVAATLLARCNGATGFFPMADTMFATQEQWLGAAASIPKDKLTELEGAPPEKLDSGSGDPHRVAEDRGNARSSLGSRQPVPRRSRRRRTPDLFCRSGSGERRNGNADFLPQRNEDGRQYVGDGRARAEGRTLALMHFAFLRFALAG